MERVLGSLRVLSELEESCKSGITKAFGARTPSVIQCEAICQTFPKYKSLLSRLHLSEMTLILYSACLLQNQDHKTGPKISLSKPSVFL